MKLKVAGHIHEVVRRGEGTLEVDGTRVEASVRASSPGSARFEGRAGSRNAAVFVTREGDRVFAQVGGRSYTMTVVSRTASAAADHAAAPGALEAPMPGRVTRVAVAVGDAVTRGQELIVVEAMKMENALIAPIDGVVTLIDAKVGDMVQPGSPLVVVEPKPAEVAAS